MLYTWSFVQIVCSLVFLICLISWISEWTFYFHYFFFLCPSKKRSLHFTLSRLTEAEKRCHSRQENWQSKQTVHSKSNMQTIHYCVQLSWKKIQDQILIFYRSWSISEKAFQLQEDSEEQRIGEGKVDLLIKTSSIVDLPIEHLDLCFLKGWSTM